MTFDGQTFESDRDGERLTRQLEKVRDLMTDGSWRTLEEIHAQTGAPPASVSARLRDLRKAKFGAFTVERKHLRRGLFCYRVLRPQEPRQSDLWSVA
jgi:DNA-binding IclR family transcriptional regulator